MTDPVIAAVAGSATVAAVVTGQGVLSQAGALLRAYLPGTSACLIADGNTWAAAGAPVERALLAAGLTVRRHILPATPRPKPTVELADSLAAVLAQDSAVPVAIGSGVLNDVVKHAAFGLDRAYLCVATAASMDGYTSAGAPLSERGFKKTIACRPARVVLADLDVISAAPRAMNGWGYGDTAGKITAGADWIIADALGIEALDPPTWDMVQAPLRGWLAQPENIAAGDPEAIARLFAGLTMVGLAMERHGSSRPASGAEHQIAHLWEMEGLTLQGEPVSHGACVAVGCVATLHLYGWLLRQDFHDLAVPFRPTMTEKSAEIRATLGNGEIADRAIAETEAKHVGAATLVDRIALLRDRWPVLRQRLAAQVMPAKTMADRLARAGCPAHAAEIGITLAALRRAVIAARFLRSRYTILDLLDDAGLLAAAVEATMPDESLRHRA